MKLLRYLFLLTILPAVSMFSQSYIVAGYYPEWIYDELPAENISYQNLTHIIHFSVWPDSDGNLRCEDWFPYPELVSTAHLKGKKVLLAVGGNSRSDGFVAMASSLALRTKFLNSLFDFVIQYNYDGVDWDWEFPADSTEGNLYTTLVKELRERFNTVNKPLSISLATSSGDWMGKYFDYNKMDQYLDCFFLMAYDYHGAWNDHSGHNAPLYSPTTDYDGSVHQSVTYLSDTRGISRDKIAVGIPFYGRFYKSKGLYEPFDTVYNINYTQADSLKNEGWNYKFDIVSKVPYLIDSGSTNLVTYENPSSIEYKSNYIRNNGLAGAMIWHLGQDIVDENQVLLEAIGNNLLETTSVESQITQNGLDDFILYDNYPNPFNPVTIIEYYIPKTKSRIIPVKLIIYDLLGQEITTLVNKFHKPGKYQVEFEASGLASGNYVYELRAGNFVTRKPMTLLK